LSLYPKKFGYSLGGYSHRERCRAPDRKKSTEERREVEANDKEPAGGQAVTTQDFINFWGKFFAFVLLEMIDFSQRFKTFESI
jgi:hypothetical protein